MVTKPQQTAADRFLAQVEQLEAALASGHQGSISDIYKPDARGDRWPEYLVAFHAEIRKLPTGDPRGEEWSQLYERGRQAASRARMQMDGTVVTQGTGG